MTVDQEYLRKLWAECAKLPPPDYVLVSGSAYNVYKQIVHRGYIVRRCFRRKGKQRINWRVGK